MKKEFIINDRENNQRFRISANAEKIYIREENPEYPFNTIGRVAVNKTALIQALMEIETDKVVGKHARS